MGSGIGVRRLKTPLRAVDLSLVAVVVRRSVSSRTPRGATRGDLGAVVVSSLVKTLFWIALVGFVGYDVISIGVMQVSVRNDAQQAAVVATDTLRTTHNVEAAYAAVKAYAAKNGDTVVAAGFSTGPHNAVTVELRRTAKTFLAAHLPRVSQYTVATASATASDPLG
jgi:hypothetical protein